MINNSNQSIFYFSTQTQHSNAGDALINRELLCLMRSSGRIKAKTSNSPKKFLDEIGLADEEIFKSSTFFMVISMIFDCLKGNNVFLVQTPGDISFKSNKIDHFFKTFLIIIFSIMGVKVIQLGISLGEFTNLQNKNLKLRSKFMYAIGLRDQISINIARKMGLSNCIYFPDLSFNIKPIQKPCKTIAKFNIALSFRSDNLGSTAEDKLIESLKKLNLELKDIDCEINFVIQVKKDLNFYKKIKKEVEFKDINFIEIYSVNELSNYYRNIDFIFSNRLHVLLLSALNGATPIAYVESEINKKIIGLFEDLGLQSNIVYYNADCNIKFFIENSDLICDKFYGSSLLENQKIISIFSKIIRKDI